MFDPDHFDVYLPRTPWQEAIYITQRSIPAQYTITRDPCGHIDKLIYGQFCKILISMKYCIDIVFCK